MCKKEITITDISKKNIVELIQLACLFNSDIFLEYMHYRINAKSIMGVMAFTPAKGMSINIITTGNDEHEALYAVENFLTQR